MQIKWSQIIKIRHEEVNEDDIKSKSSFIGVTGKLGHTLNIIVYSPNKRLALIVSANNPYIVNDNTRELKMVLTKGSFAKSKIQKKLLINLSSALDE